MAAKSGAKVTVDRVNALKRDLMDLVGVEVLVGFPEDTSERKEEDGEAEITNAAIAYIQDNGAPERNIPARPFMVPAIEGAQTKIANTLVKMAEGMLAPNRPRDIVQRGYHAVGLVAQAAIRDKISEGIPPPLSEYTLRNRARKGDKTAQAELESRKAGNAPSSLTARPLVDTAQMRNAVNYVIRDRKRRRK